MSKSNQPREYQIQIYKLVGVKKRKTSQAAKMVASEIRKELKGKGDYKVDVAGIFT